MCGVAVQGEKGERGESGGPGLPGFDGLPGPKVSGIPCVMAAFIC